jgi:formylmethanofuran dehydrogenase subunit C
MPLLLALRRTFTISLEVESVRVEIVREQTVDQVKATRIAFGNRQVDLAEFFEVTGSAAEDQEIVWEGDCSRVKRIGESQTQGRMRVDGHAGMHVGALMTGGEILISGNVGDWAGAEMKGGRLIIQGNAGNCLGAGYRGATKGMTGGEILVHGSAGDEAGSVIRRGLIAIAGTCGAATGFGMIAGSILIFGRVGTRCGAGMKRGTIGLFANDPDLSLLPTFHPARSISPTFLRIYLRYLESRGFPVPPQCADANYRRYNGDLLELGKGEILVRES